MIDVTQCSIFYVSYFCYLLCLLFFFFFFQAEDGIRDGHVTGVQTCALPISTKVNPWAPSWAGDAMLASSTPFASKYSTRVARSEERRVGKECRSRWWADH